MHFRPSIGDKELPTAIRRALALGTTGAWQRNMVRLKEEARHNPFATYYHAEHYLLERTMERFRQYEAKTGRVPDVLQADPGAYRFAAFVGMLVNVYDRLSPGGQTVLAGRLRGGLTDDVGLEPLAFELLIASHFMQKGADVEWHDLESGGGYDFLVRQGSAIAEVECKSFSADIGRKVHQKRHYQLGGLVCREIGAAVERRGSFFLDVVIEDRLAGRAIEDVAKVIRGSLRSGRSFQGPSPCSIELHSLSPSELTFNRRNHELDEADIRAFVETRFGRLNPSLLVLSRTGRGVAFVVTRSAKPDEVVDGMYRQLKKGAEQFTGMRAAILCAHVLDLTPSQLFGLHAAQERGEHSGLNSIATRLFKESRSFLHTVQFSVPGRLREVRTQQGNFSRRHLMESGPTYFFVNPNHPLCVGPGQGRQLF